MAIQGKSLHRCNHGHTYSSIEEWIASHGYVGTRELNLISGDLVLNPDGQSVTRTLVWENEEQFNTWKASRQGGVRNYSTEKIVKENI